MIQATQKAPQRTPLASHMRRGLQEGALFIFGFTALYLLLALVSFELLDPGWSQSVDGRQVQNLGGPVGAWFADIFLSLFGYLAYLFPIMVGYSGWLVFQREGSTSGSEMHNAVLRSTGFLLVLGSGCGLAHIHYSVPVIPLPIGVGAGGILGDLIGTGMESALGFLGATLLMLALFLSGVTLFTHLSWLRLMDVMGGFTLNGFDWLRSQYVDVREWLETWRARKDRTESSRTKVAEEIDRQAQRRPPRIEPVIERVPQSDRAQREQQIPMFVSEADQLPPLSLLDSAEKSEQALSSEALAAMSRLVELKLQDFGIQVEVVAVHPGPVITRFELQPVAGIKVSQITNLTKDLARALSTISVRVVEVIPGKTTIGLEVPNEYREVVRLSDTLKSKQYEMAGGPLKLALGVDISGHPVVVDLARMPHLLVAGTTGAGKSVALNAMLLSILYTATPKEVRLILIDPKMLELSVYEGIPHLLAPVVTDMKEAANGLRWCVAEMERRYQLMAELKVRNLNGFNRKIIEAQAAGKPITDPLPSSKTGAPAANLEQLPNIVVVVDELADMMMVVGKKVEEFIARLAQMARASGIHLILATQRPSVDILTGLIKANIPTRIAFQVSSRVDSRTILDQMGAEQLLGHGDMLYLPPGTAVPMRVHGAFVADQEVSRVVDNLKKQGTTNYLNEVLSEKTGMEDGFLSAIDDDTEGDPLYDKAVRIVTETRRASISGVQRQLKVGYNRAARMVEAMERAGIVGPLESNGNREILVPPPTEAEV